MRRRGPNINIESKIKKTSEHDDVNSGHVATELCLDDAPRDFGDCIPLSVLAFQLPAPPPPREVRREKNAAVESGLLTIVKTDS